MTFIKRYKYLLSATLLLFCIVLMMFGIMPLPSPLFDAPCSTVLLDRNGELLSASVARDGQWRFPPGGTIPEKFFKAATCYEDHRFFYHPGIDPIAVIRALWQNLISGQIVSGASTLTMQVIRLSRKGQPRTVKEKLIEAVMAVQLELRHTKSEIFSLYASHAPFGGNVVGLEAASWRYFGREPFKLSWAETATLAVLPNSPSLIHPGKNRERLKAKRDALLDRLYRKGAMDFMTCELSKKEPLPSKPVPLPMLAPHLLERVKNEFVNRNFNNGMNPLTSQQALSSSFQTPNSFYTTLVKHLQVQADEIIRRHHRTLAANEIHNAAALILEVQTGNVLAYIGNVSDFSDTEHGNHVDIITSPRSTGSILKPFLYAGMLHDGEILPTQLTPDIPTRMGGFAPQNYSRTYQGAVPAYLALARSLNVPAVRMLYAYGVDRFYDFLKQLGMTTLTRPAQDYGLSLILGGAEGTLWDITGIYAGMARTVNNFHDPQTMNQSAFFPPRLISDPLSAIGHQENASALDTLSAAFSPLDAADCWLTLQAMQEVSRPDEESGWEYFQTSQAIAWKTGTSYGFRDGWAIGVTPKYAVGVWTGNADGEGRPGLTGIQTAAPILFELFGMLDVHEGFKIPEAALTEIEVCAHSGFRPGPNCNDTVRIAVPLSGLRSKACPFCKTVHCDKNGYRVTSNCESISDIVSKKWFVLPPVMEWYYKQKHADYDPLPPYRDDCAELIAGHRTPSMNLIYPAANSRLYIPIELSGKLGRTVFEATHRNPKTIVYWHLDQDYMGFTQDIHQMALAPEPGEHVLTLVDENGERLEHRFTVLSKQLNESYSLR